MANLNLRLPFRELQTSSRSVWLRGIVALVIVISALLMANWTIPKTYIYGILRELAKDNALYKVQHLMILEGQHFIVHYEPENADLAPMVLENAEKVYQPVVNAFGYQPKEKVNIIVYPTRGALNKSFGWEADESAMGVYWAGVIRVLAPDQWIDTADDQELTKIFASDGPMAHEFSHLVIDYRTRGNYPRWLTEGLAQYQEYKLTGFRFTEPQGRLTSQLYPFDQMDKHFDYLPNQSLAYRQSLAAVQFLVEQYGANSLEELLQELGKGVALPKAVQDTIGLDSDSYEQVFAQWVAENVERL